MLTGLLAVIGFLESEADVFRDELNQPDMAEEYDLAAEVIRSIIRDTPIDDSHWREHGRADLFRALDRAQSFLEHPGKVNGADRNESELAGFAAALEQIKEWRGVKKK